MGGRVLGHIQAGKRGEAGGTDVSKVLQFVYE